METEIINWKEYIDEEKFENLLEDIFDSQGYSISLFNNEGKKLVRKNRDKQNHLVCEELRENENFCNEHYLKAQEAITGKRGNLSFCAKNRERFLFCAPFKTSSGKNLGAIVACKKAKFFDSNGDNLEENKEEVNFLKGITSLLADKIYQDIEIRHLSAELNAKYEELALLYEIGEKTLVSDRKDESVEYIVTRAMETVNPSLVVWSVREENKNIFYRNPERESEDKFISDEIIMEICRKVSRMSSRSREPLILNNLNKYREFAGIWQDPINVLSIPLVSDSKGFGSLNFIECNPEKIFLNDQLKLMESISRSTVTILKNSELYEKLQKLFFNVVRMLLGIIESKDTYTEGHSKRVYQISVQFAKILKLSRKDIFDLQWGAILHDVGKITIPTEIIKKPGKLTSEEYEIIKSHPVKGAELVSTIDEFKNAVKGIRYHHERIDGKGYPDGLRGTEIPLIARIIGIADTFDALNSARPYRAKPSRAFVLAELKQLASTQLDSLLVELLLNNYELFIKLLDSEDYELFEDTNIKGIW
ncbi:MAG: hypothetical protein A2149_06650 [Candidatus Schekmanbacteria bacterium RBG_16_38_11]|uniref:Uncharacterized protein n=1 Tax=Candidatus Schekmanbacteria bacterium RBG_16_38_11 TaxID=1817880 RepID=A0A1F7RZ19_9BACT|nr:MAG: hypothetical protein A2149_06650 [Candidatus Schekmanbacteria bacterium RBG_16_38_11]